MQKTWSLAVSSALLGIILTGCSKAASPGQSGKWGYINKTGNFIIQPQFDEASNFKKDGAIVRDGKRLLRLQANPPGESLVSVKPNDTSELAPLPTLRAAQGDGDTYKVMDGETVVFEVKKKPATEAVFHGNDYVCALFGKKYAFIDKNGGLAFGTPFTLARDFSEGRAAIQEGGKWGFITRKGRFALPPKYLDAGSFVDGLAPVKVPLDQK